MPGKPLRTFTPSPGASKQWILSSQIWSARLFSKGSSRYQISDRCEQIVKAMPAGYLWQVMWQGWANVHWAFWCVFFAPLLIMSMLAITLSSEILLGIIDILSVGWVMFSIVLVWRSGYGHPGWAFTPNLYRLAMLIYAGPLLVLIFSIVLGGFH